jgi:hypothetical protein
VALAIRDALATFPRTRSSSPRRLTATLTERLTPTSAPAASADPLRLVVVRDD